MTPEDLKNVARESFRASKRAMESGDSNAVARFVRLSTMQAALNGSVSAALSLEMIARLRDLERQLSYVTKLADTGSQEHKAAFDPEGIYGLPTGWRVVEKMREAALDALGKQ